MTQSSYPKAKKEIEGYESVRELFEDNYYDPIYESKVSDGTVWEAS